MLSRSDRIPERDEQADRIAISISHVRQLKTARGHLMRPQQHLYNGVARPADYAIFVRERTWTRLLWQHCTDSSGGHVCSDHPGVLGLRCN